PRRPPRHGRRRRRCPPPAGSTGDSARSARLSFAPDPLPPSVRCTPPGRPVTKNFGQRTTNHGPPTMQTVATVVDYLAQFAPPALAADWDNVGLLLGERGAEVRRVLTCLTVTPEVAAEAVETGVQLIVTHHPVLFRAVKRLTGDTAEGRMLCALIRAGVAVYSPHPAFDNTQGGINELLARRLGLTRTEPLVPREGPGQCKLVVFVPDADLAKVSDALFAAGAGHIGQYSQC